MDPALILFVKLRDGDCVARYCDEALWSARWPMLQGLPEPGPCRDAFGSALPATRPVPMMVLDADHVHDADAHAMGAKAQDDADHLWSVCPGHHTGTDAGRQWATNSEVRRAAPVYIAAANGFALRRGWPVRPAEEVTA
jgi:hypothetical protein